MRTSPTMAMLSILVLLAGPAVHAGESGEADVAGVEVTRTGDDTFRFNVTISSNETGWDYYADAFEIVGPDGEVLGRRTLHHPHVDEQPFTRSLGGVEIPAGIDTVTIRAHHSEAGYDGRTLTVELPR